MMTLYLSMAGFALAISIFPGLRTTLRHIADVTLGFILPPVLPGFGLTESLRGGPAATSLIRRAGAGFLSWMS